MTTTYGPAALLAGCSAMLVVFAVTAAPTDGAWVASLVLAAMVAGAAVTLALETAAARRRGRRGLGTLPDGTLRRLDREDDR